MTCVASQLVNNADALNPCLKLAIVTNIDFEGHVVRFHGVVLLLRVIASDDCLG